MTAGTGLAGLVNLISVNEHQASACYMAGPPVNEIIPLSLQQIVYLIFIMKMFAGHGKSASLRMRSMEMPSVFSAYMICSIIVLLYTKYNDL